MIIENGLFTSESVSEGHPDKIADQVSDTILDSFLEKDARSRVACETVVAPGLIAVLGEINSDCYVDITDCVKNVLSSIGYNHAKKGLDYKSCSVLTSINHQSKDISRAVGFGKAQGAGDQGMMFGYAVNETPELMPLGVQTAHRLMKELAHLRKSGHDFLWPDSKSQVTVEYKNSKIHSIHTIIISTQHSPDISLKNLREFIVEKLIKKAVPKKYLKSTNYIINPAGKFNIGGPEGDCGLTGRKIIVDTYGGYGSHGGGAFSGKDPSKVDRSGAYITRHIAKNLVAGGFAKKCLVQISYAIGRAKPISIHVQDYGTSQFSKTKLAQIVSKNWDLTPYGIIKELQLLRPRYRATSVYGHFGRNENQFTWEKIKTLKKV